MPAAHCLRLKYSLGSRISFLVNYVLFVVISKLNFIAKIMTKMTCRRKSGSGGPILNSTAVTKVWRICSEHGNVSTPHLSLLPSCC